MVYTIPYILHYHIYHTTLHYSTVMYCTALYKYHIALLDAKVSVQRLGPGWITEKSGFDTRHGQNIFLFPKAFTCSLLHNEDRGGASFILGASGLKTKPPTYLHLDPRLRVSGAIHPVPYMLSWREEGKPCVI